MLLVMSPDVVTWPRLLVVDSVSPPLIMGEKVEVKPTHVVHMLIQYWSISEEHEFAMVKTAVGTFILRNDFGSRVGFLVDQQGPRVFMKREFKTVGPATTK